MATLAIQTIDADGLDPQLVPASAGGDKVVPGQGSYVEVRNTSGLSVQVTLVTPGTVDGDLAIADRTITVPATTGVRKVAVGNRYRDPADGLASITYSAVTSVTVGSFRGPVGD